MSDFMKLRPVGSLCLVMDTCIKLLLRLEKKCYKWQNPKLEVELQF
jgi:hypothetical protein